MTRGTTLNLAWTADNGDGTYRNPVLHADWSDPDAIRVGDDFYMTASSFNRVPGLPILHSRAEVVLVDRSGDRFVGTADVVVVQPEELLEVAKVRDFVVRELIVSDHVAEDGRVNLAALRVKVSRSNAALTEDFTQVILADVRDRRCRQ